MIFLTGWNGFVKGKQCLCVIVMNWALSNYKHLLVFINLGCGGCRVWCPTVQSRSHPGFPRSLEKKILSNGVMSWSSTIPLKEENEKCRTFVNYLSPQLADFSQSPYNARSIILALGYPFFILGKWIMYVHLYPFMKAGLVFSSFYFERVISSTWMNGFPFVTI